jgi:hypothetical protein
MGCQGGGTIQGRGARLFSNKRECSKMRRVSPRLKYFCEAGESDYDPGELKEKLQPCYRSRRS